MTSYSAPSLQSQLNTLNTLSLTEYGFYVTSNANINQPVTDGDVLCY